MDKQQKQSDRDILMEDLGETLGYVQEFVAQEVESVKLEVAEKVSIASSSIITGLVLTTFGSLGVIMASIALGFYLGSLFNSNTVGFLIVSGIFFILLPLIYLFRKTLITDSVVTAVIQLFFDQEEDENHQ